MYDNSNLRSTRSDFDDRNDKTLVIDDLYNPKIREADVLAIHGEIIDFVQSYLKKPTSVHTKDWLKTMMASKLPDISSVNINAFTKEITTTLNTIESKKLKLAEADKLQVPKEQWFYFDVKNSVSNMSALEGAKYLHKLDGAIKVANERMTETILTKSGQINQNPNLDGFIAEQHHVNTFNLEAEARGSEYRARVLKPGDKGYRANSVDIVVENKNTGKVDSRYQVKYGKDAKATARSFKKGNYRGQQKLVPVDQKGKISKKTTSTLKAADGTKSKPLSKKNAKRMQKAAQKGKPKKYDYNDYDILNLALGITKEAGKSALYSMASTAGYTITKKVWKKEKIDGEELLKETLKSGVDAGLKTAAAGALKTLSERGILKLVPKGTPAFMCAAIGSAAIDNLKILYAAVNGEITGKEAAHKMGQTTVSTIAGSFAATKCAAIGASIGTFLGPVGTVIGGAVGGCIGYMAGSTVGTCVVDGAIQLGDMAISELQSNDEKSDTKYKTSINKTDNIYDYDSIYNRSSRYSISDYKHEYCTDKKKESLALYEKNRQVKKGYNKHIRKLLKNK